MRSCFGPLPDEVPLKNSRESSDIGGMVQHQVAGAGDVLEGSQLVLVVEDDPDVREVVKLSLEGAGYQVVTAGDGKAGITHARQLQPDAIRSEERRVGTE